MSPPYATEALFESMAMVSVSAPVNARLTPRVVLGAHRHENGELDLRDGVVGLGWTVVAKDTFVLKVEPGLNLPIGSLEDDGLAFTPLSTTSVDPFVQVDVVYGATYLIGSTLSARFPVYAGSDGVRQGAFSRLDVWGARRFGDVVPWVGVSAVGLAASEPIGAPAAFAELAALGGAVFHLAPRWSVTAQTRLPVPEVATRQAVRGPAFGIGVSAVIGGRKEEEHHEGDGHDHGESHHEP